MREEHFARLKQVLIAPLVSEKTSMAGERENSVTFWVKTDASKTEIKHAVEKYFPDVKVESVRTTINARKFVTFGNRKGRAKKRKKAYVKLKAGCEIQFTDFE